MILDCGWWLQPSSRFQRDSGGWRRVDVLYTDTGHFASCKGDSEIVWSGKNHRTSGTGTETMIVRDEVLADSIRGLRYAAARVGHDGSFIAGASLSSGCKSP